MNFEEAVNKFKEESSNLERVNKSSIEFTIMNLRNLIDFGKHYGEFRSNAKQT